MKIIAFLTRTRHPGRIHITDIMSWVWLVVGTLLVMIPVMWAAMSSFKTPAEINRFPPSFLPQAADTVTLPEYPKPLELWQVKQEDGEAKTMALVRRIGLIAQLVNPDAPSEVVRVSTKDLVPMKALHLETENYTTPITKFHFATYLKNTVFRDGDGDVADSVAQFDGGLCAIEIRVSRARYGADAVSLHDDDSAVGGDGADVSGGDWLEHGR
nr:hypothetical protein [Pectobacterium versatile]